MRPRWLGLPRGVALGFAAALVAVAAAAVASYVALAARADAGLLVRHTAEAQLATEKLQSSLLLSDGALTEYAAEGDRRHYDQFVRTSASLRPGLAELQRVSLQHPEEKPVVARVAAGVEVVHAERARLIALIEAGALGQARALAGQGLARVAIERALAALAQIDADEARAHEGREAAWTRSVRISNAVFVTAVGLLLVLIGRAARLVAVEIRAREAEAVAREHALVVQHRLMAVVSHDLRNPLTGILTRAQALERSTAAPEAASLARGITAAGRRMERLIRDLLDWTRLEAGAAIPIALREADVVAICARIVDELNGRHGARVTIEQEGDPRAVVDPDRLEQIVENLVTNALRYAAPDSPIRVRVTGAVEETRLEVENQGPGIPPELRSELFQAFRQGPDGHGSGAGLGLYIVRAAAAAHGGTVEIDSAAGRTTFVVRLPRARVPPRSGAAEGSA